MEPRVIVPITCRAILEPLSCPSHFVVPQKMRKSNCQFDFIIDDLFDGNSYEASIGEHDSERWFVLVEFVLGNIRVMDQA
jgi:hypothetical protein